MEIIKEYCEIANKCVIRTNTYVHTWKHFNMLVNIAREDFPLLKEEDIEIVMYAGRNYDRTFVIEFGIVEQPYDNYFTIEQLERTK